MAKPIKDVIEILKKISPDLRSETLNDAIGYLEQLEDIRRSIFDRHMAGYFGRLPVTQIGDEFYAIRDYVPEYNAWRCDRVRQNDRGRWYVDDDDVWIIDRDGNIQFKERGWDLRKVKPEE